MSHSIQVRRAKVDDFPALLELINLAFFKGDARRFETALPHLYTDPPVATKMAYLAELDGHLVGHVGIYPIELRCGQVELSAGGVGAVGCHPDFRGRGVMSALLPVAIRGMEEAGFDVSVLWGARTRYRRYGWDDCGRRLEWRLDASSPALVGVKPLDLRPIEPQRDLPVATRLWNSDSVGTIQTDAGMARLLKRKWTFELAAGGSALVVTEIVGDKLVVDKLVGPEDNLLPVLLALRERAIAAKQTLFVRCPTGDYPLARLANVAGEWLAQYTVGQARIIRPDRLAAKLNIAPAVFEDRIAAVQSLFGSPIGLASPIRRLPLYIENPAHV